MTWSLQFRSKAEARIITSEGRPVGGFLDWLTAQDLVTEHNRAIDRRKSGIAITLAEAAGIVNKAAGKA
jgi:hypothetical protein